MATHAIPSEFVSGSARLRSRLRDALLRTTKYLPGRPEPRWQWNELAAEGSGVGSAPRMRSAFAHAAMLRATLEAAQRRGPEAFEATRALVTAYFLIEEAVVFEGFDAPSEECKIRALAEVVRELGEASTAAAAFAADPNSVTHGVALEEVLEARDAIDGYAEKLASGQWLTPLSA